MTIVQVMSVWSEFQAYEIAEVLFSPSRPSRFRLLQASVHEPERSSYKHENAAESLGLCNGIQQLPMPCASSVLVNI